MMNLKYTFLLFVLIGLFMQLKAQEVLVELQIDGSLNNYHRTHQVTWKSQQESEPVFLPFFDDFNQDSYRPNADLWVGENVYINKKFQLIPPDLGVATFDAMNGSGYIHENASQFAFAADTLTSQSIRLDSIMDPTLRPMLVKDSVYFSFYFQPQGRGNAPESEDILSLEFYSPVLNQWFPVWSSEGLSLQTFFSQNSVFSLPVFIPLTDSVKYFHSDFKFRFHNMASLAGSSQPDWQSNCDHWNIDLVWLENNRTITDSSYRKIAFVNRPPSMIKDYQAMPYRQYKNDPTNSMNDVIDSIVIRNMDNNSYIANYQYKISNQTTQDSIYDGQTVKIDPFKEAGFLDYQPFTKPRVISFFSIYNEPRKSYTITHTINDVGFTGVGDTAIRVQEFSNYYAYDDGTAEAGYGLSVGNAKTAMKFKLNTKDTLRRVQFYFNPTLSDANEQYFDLMVWKRLDPEEIIYTKRVKVQFTEGLYDFYTYDLDTSIVLANEFYVGFKQLNETNLNVGFDYAIDSKENLFFNIGTGWNPSIYNGSIMIRPVFGEVDYTSVSQVENVDGSFTMYPNPINTSDLNFMIDNGQIDDYQIEIISITGQVLLHQKLEPSISISSLNRGVYIVRLYNTKNAVSKTQKLIISR